MVYRNLIAALLVAAAGVLCNAQARAAAPAWLAKMPSPAQVVQKVRGADAFDTAARQHAALTRLMAILRDQAGVRALRNQLSVQEQQLLLGYASETRRVQKGLIDSLPKAQQAGAGSLRERWFKLTWGYERDPAFNQQLLAMFFQKGFQQDLASAQQQAAAQVRALSQPRAQAGQPSSERALPTWDQTRNSIATAGTRQSNPLRTLVEGDVPPQWRWTLEQRTWIAVFAGLFVFGFFWTLAPFGLAAGNPFLLRVGGRRSTIDFRVGVVTNVQRWSEVETTPTRRTEWLPNGGTVTVHGSYSSSTNKTQIMLRDASGKVHEVTLWKLDVAVAVGQVFLAVAVFRRGKKSGYYVMVHNYDLGRTQYLDALVGITNLREWPGFCLAAALLCTNLPWWMALAAFLTYELFVLTASKIRVRHFKKNLSQRIIAAVSKPDTDNVIVGSGGVMVSPA